MPILAMILPVCPTIYGSTINLPQQACVMAAPLIAKTSSLCRQLNFIAMAKYMIKTACGILWPMVCHLILPVPDAKETAPDLIARAQAAGAYVSLAHPEWYTMTTDEAMQVAAADAVEIYNHSCVVSSARGSGIAIADYLLNEGKKISFTATDDSHFELPDWGGGWVMVAAAELSQNAIVVALKAGHHYASTGADFADLQIEDGVLTVTSSPVENVVISGAGHMAMAETGKDMTVTRFDLAKFRSEWFRITSARCGWKDGVVKPLFIKLF